MSHLMAWQKGKTCLSDPTMPAQVCERLVVRPLIDSCDEFGPRASPKENCKHKTAECRREVQDSAPLGS